MLSQETIESETAVAEITARKEHRQSAKPSHSIQALVDSLKSAADDIGQISELSSEEKLLVAEFFKSLLRTMQPLASAMPVSTSVVQDLGVVVQAHIDPTGHLVLLFEDGRLELRNLDEEKNRDLMMAVVEDVIPKFKDLTIVQKRKIEDRIKFLSAVTKEIQKISETMTSILGSS
jgi:hypothetical protein